MVRFANQRALARTFALATFSLSLWVGCDTLYDDPNSVDYYGEVYEAQCPSAERLGDICAVGSGQCRTRGTWICEPETDTLTCSAEPGAAKTETCDGLDNNCDGIVDNLGGADSGVDLDDDVENCGRCGVDCAALFPNASATCAEGGCEMSGCDEGYVDVNGFPGDGCECERTSSNGDSSCDGVDSDCDGVVDEDCRRDTGTDADATGTEDADTDAADAEDADATDGSSIDSGDTSGDVIGAP